jgi:predicted PurR-regulated permease PerM
MGKKLGLAPLIVVISLVFWGWIWGPVGMILSVPLTMALKIYLEHTDTFQWGAILLGREPIAPKLPPSLES